MTRARVTAALLDRMDGPTLAVGRAAGDAERTAWRATVPSTVTHWHASGRPWGNANNRPCRPCDTHRSAQGGWTVAAAVCPGRCPRHSRTRPRGTERAWPADAGGRRAPDRGRWRVTTAARGVKGPAPLPRHDPEPQSAAAAVTILPTAAGASQPHTAAAPPEGGWSHPRRAASTAPPRSPRHSIAIGGTASTDGDTRGGEGPPRIQIRREESYAVTLSVASRGLPVGSPITWESTAATSTVQEVNEKLEITAAAGVVA